jgi:electron transfer flavoprotein alpha subunit
MITGMETLLILAHTESDGSVAGAALETLTAALQLNSALPGPPIAIGLVGERVQPAANRLAGCGAARFLAASHPALAQARYSTDAAAAEAVVRAAQASIVIAPATSRWNRVLPGVAQRLGGRVDTHAAGVAASEGAVSISRWYYRQRMEATLRRSQRPWFILIDPGAYAPWQGQLGAANVEPLALELPENLIRTEVLGFREPAIEARTIRPEAEVLFVAGAGWTKKQADGQPKVKEAEKLILGFLNQARASLGSSKSLVDLSGEGQAVLSFLTHLNQVGQTGSTPRHPKGLATCCHGEEPHTVGWRFIHERRAINLDPNCGWARGKADVLYVADAFAVVAKVNEILAQAGAS